MQKVIILFLICISQLSNAQNLNPADRDPDFNAYPMPLDNYFVDKNVVKSVVLANGKILILTGDYKLVRLIGNLRDNTFMTGVFSLSSGSYAMVNTFLPLANGKILVGGDFNMYNGRTTNGLMRLNEDGSLDQSFNAALSNISTPLEIVEQADGKILVVGNSSRSNSRFDNLYRYNANGSEDASFVTTPNYKFQNIALQSDGKIIVNHNTQSSFYSAVNKISRLNSDGSFDTTFTTSSFTAIPPRDPYVRKIIVLSDDKIVASGEFTGASSTSSQSLIKFNSDGSVDTSFSVGTGFSDGRSNSYESVLDVAEQNDGKLLAGGYFKTYNDANVGNLIRINTDGSLDESFANVSSFLNIERVSSISFFNDQKLLASGTLGYVRKFSSYIAKINTDGTRDGSFNNRDLGFFNTPVNAIVETPDSKLLVGGSFFTYDGEECVGFTRLNENGLKDPTLTYGGLSGFKSDTKVDITAIARRSDGKIYIAGNFSSYNGQPARSIIRINEDGTRDMSFDAGNGLDYGITEPGIIRSIVLTPEGDPIVGGNFIRVGNGSTGGLVKFNSTGYGYNYANANTSDYYQLKYQADGKLLMSYSQNLKRINTNGSNDASFVLDSSITSPQITSFEIQEDGKIIISGIFYINGVKANIARISNNGSLDSTFNFVQGTLDIKGIELLPDNKILIFMRDEVGYTLRGKIIRLHTDGSVDNTYREESTIYGQNIKFKKVNSGKVLLYGTLSQYQNKPAWGLIRLIGADYYYLKGQNRLDVNNNGCDAQDINVPNLKLTVSSGSNPMTFFPDNSGNYTIGLTEGNYTVTPVVENPSYFSITPSSVAVSFPSQSNQQLQNFCASPIGVHHDLEILIISLEVARPGFDARYKIIYKNKGNQTQSGTIGLDFDDSLMDLVNAQPNTSNRAVNRLNWNFSNLKPFESREIIVRMNLNTPTEIPAVTDSTFLEYTASINSDHIDESPEDNIMVFNQRVVNSYDPNDKTCLEGTKIAIAKVGDYVHYLIRFENTGSYFAQNVTITDLIDVSKYEISSLVPLKGSHSFVTMIKGNSVDFYFESINLPFDDATNDGYVSFKIRTKTTLHEGDSFSNTAAIYFDYNYPIITNTAVTEVVMSLSVEKFAMKNTLFIYPNPVNALLKIGYSAEGIKIEVQSLSIYNVLGQLMITIPNAKDVKLVDVSKLTTGNYVIKFFTNEGILSEKFIKE